MKKNILFLINGFGIEQADSYSVYSERLVPNLDMLTKEYLFNNIKSKYLDISTAYRKFSIGIDRSLAFNTIEENIFNDSYKKNELIKSIVDKSKLDNSILHVVFYYENDESISQLLMFIRFLGEQNIKVFVHIVLCQNSLESYKNMDNLLTRINYDMENVSIGMMCGEKQITNTKDILKICLSANGEYWNNITKKIEVLIGTKTLPQNCKPFIVDKNCKISTNEQILFFNYNVINANVFTNEINNSLGNSLMFYSLFKTSNESKIPYCYNYSLPNEYAAKTLEENNLKCVLFDTKDNCNVINYYMTGMSQKLSDNVKYIATDDNLLYDKDRLLNVIKSRSEQLLIINYSIENSINIEDLENRLRYIDAVLGLIVNYINESNSTLIISSLYGMQKELINSKHELKNVNFSGKVPLIIVDKEYTKNNYYLIDGDLKDLFNTTIFILNTKYKCKSLLRKKSSLLSVFYKKN